MIQSLVYGGIDFDRNSTDHASAHRFTCSLGRQLLTNAGLHITIEKSNVRHKKRIVQLLDMVTLRRFQDHFTQQWMFVARKTNDTV
jgi:hypothetical protein